MRKFGLAAILTFVDKGATAAMGRVGRRAAALKMQFAAVGRGVAQMRAGLASMATAALPVAAGFGLMLKKGADFQQAIAKLRAVTLDTANRSTPALRSLAKTLGATTVFSATQAADAMTSLARAGLKPNQIMAAVRGTLNAAAAEGIGLAEAADMVASNIKAFNIPAMQASRIAGLLALASARTNTNMSQLQEGLKLAAPAAGLVNASLADTTAVLGAFADIGLKGTLGGTAFRAALTKLVNPSKQGRKAIAGLGLSMGALNKRLDKGDVIGAFQLLVDRLKSVPSAAKRAGLASKILGLRGVALSRALNLSDENMKRFNATLAEMRKETGETAKRMAKIQLATLTGQVKLLASAFEGVSIEIFDLVAGNTAGLVKNIATTLGQLALAMRVVGGEKIVDPDARRQLAEIPPAIFEVARGIREAFGEIKETFRSVGESLSWLADKFGLTGDGSARSIAKIATKVVVLTAAFAPLALVLGGVTKLFGGLARTAFGAVRTVTGALGGIFRGFRGLGKLGKVGKLADLATAMPVRVVNFHEMGGLGGIGGGRTSGAREIDLAGSRAAGVLGKFKDKINGVSSRLGRAGLLGAALGAGYALGTLIDRMTGASTIISNAAHDFAVRMRDKAIAPIKKEEATLRETVRAAETLNQLIGLSKRGVGIQTAAGGPRQEITRELARERLLATLSKQELTQKQVASVLERLSPLLAKLPAAGSSGAGTKPVKAAKDALVSTGGLLPVSAGDVVLDRASLASAIVSQVRGGLAGRATGGALGGGDPGQTSPPPAAPRAPLRIEVPVQVDGVAIARAVAEVQLDELERGGASMPPGARRGLLERGLLGGGV